MVRWSSVVVNKNRTPFQVVDRLLQEPNPHWPDVAASSCNTPEIIDRDPHEPLQQFRSRVA